jgi:penicillin amidase
MRLARLLAAAVTLVALGYAGSRSIGPLPALGPFLDPASGVFGLGRSASLPAAETAAVPGLRAPVEVRIDDRGVPHVFAESEEDAWRAQGYLVARDRLFQMELLTRSAAGTLSEVFGPRALESDRTARRRGLAWAADRSFASADPGALIVRAATAYADGVNAWIDAMPRAALPLEYRLTGSRPTRWQPKHTYYLFAQMALTLAYDDETLARLSVRARVGAEATEALFPLNSPIQEPIQPNGHRAPRFDFTPLPPPGVPDSLAAVAFRERRAVNRRLGLAPESVRPADAIGSNNWAVAPSRTAAGFALLAGATHHKHNNPTI